MELIHDSKYETSNSIIMVQNRLYSPFYAGPGKWVIYNPKSKKAYLAIGKDKVPEIVEWLVYHSKYVLTESNESRIKKLIDNGLLVEPKSNLNTYNNFVEHYQQACFDYPFKDYYEDNWMETDIKKMEHYSTMWEQPSKFTIRPGEPITLPKVNIENLKSKNDRLNFISAVLKYCFGPMEKITGQFEYNIRKTAPSGGAKHPTEVVLCLKNNMGNIKKGLYIYDALNHTLLADDNYSSKDLGRITGEFGFLLRFRVERPMWRYREIRSFRAIFLDLGHVVSNIKEVLGAVNYKVVSKDPINNKKNFDWVREPEVLLIDVKQGNEESNNAFNEEFVNEIEHNERHVITNPTLYFTFRDGRLIANNLWPSNKKTKITLDEFMALTHCLPSRRGDRSTDNKGIITSVPRITSNNIKSLKSNNLLLPFKLGRKFYKEVNLWAVHGWYLNFLTYLEIIHSMRNTVIEKDKGSLFNKIDLYNSMVARKTTRGFNNFYTIKLSEFNDITNLLSKNINFKNTTVFLNIHNVEGYEQGLYSLQEDGDVQLTNDVLEREKVRELIIGQKWASDGSMQLFVVKHTDLSKPARQMIDLIELGNIGQLMYLVTTDQSLGVFTTPAIKDTLSNDALNIKDPFNSLFYFVTVGKRKGEMDT